MNLKKLLKLLSVETDQEKRAELIKKIDALIIKRGSVKIANIGYLESLDIESQICKRDVFEKGYFNCDTWGNSWGYPTGPNCIYIQPDYSGIDIVLSVNEQYAISCRIKSAQIHLYYSGINAPNADRKQIGELCRKSGIPRCQYNNCLLFIRK